MKTIITSFVFLLTTLGMASDITPEIRLIEDEALYSPHFGASFGTSSPEGSFNTTQNFGLEFGLQPIIPFSYTIKANYAEFADGDRNLSRTIVSIEGKYNFGGKIPVVKHSYVGLGAGPAWEAGSVDDDLAFIFYPQVGFDLPLQSVVDAPISFGLNSSYIVSTRSTPDTFNLNGVVKYWY